MINSLELLDFVIDDLDTMWYYIISSNTFFKIFIFFQNQGIKTILLSKIKKFMNILTYKHHYNNYKPKLKLA